MSREENTAAKPVSVDDLLKVITALGESQKNQFLEAARAMAEGIIHPSPTPPEVENRLKEFASRWAMAKENEAIKANKRKHCVPPADPHRPHRRPIDSDQGIWGGKTVIAWAYSAPTIKTELGSKDGPLTAYGV